MKWNCKAVDNNKKVFLLRQSVSSASGIARADPSVLFSILPSLFPSTPYSFRATNAHSRTSLTADASINAIWPAHPPPALLKSTEVQCEDFTALVAFSP